MEPIAIRPAEEADVPIVHRFARMIAEHMDEVHKFQCTQDDIRRALFRPPRCVEALIAWRGDEPVGCVTFMPKFSSYTGKTEIYVEDLSVAESARGSGVGRRLLAHLGDVAAARGATRLEWFVDDGNASAMRFYENLGARVLGEVSIMRLRLPHH